MRTTLSLLTLLLGAAPLYAADCPVAADLARGIRLSEGADVSETFRQERPGLVTSVYSEAGVQTRALLLGGLYMVEILELGDTGAPVPSSRITFSFSDPPGGRPAPASGAGWDGTMTTLDGGSIYAEPFVVRFGPEDMVRFGACSYRAIPVNISYPDQEPPYFEELTWLVDLGFSFLTANSANDGSVVRFSYDRIEALP